MCSETSPRISFSNDLVQEDEIQIEQDPRRDTRLLETSSDFEFSVCSNLLDHQSSLADEIFADGMILPIQIHCHTHESSRKVSLPPLPCSSTTSEDSRNSRKCAFTTSENSKNSRKKEMIVLNSELEEKTQSNSNSKSFWGFKRSSSLNDLKKSLIFSLPRLSRSNSTGSSIPNPKKPSSSSSSQKKLLSASSASSSSTYVYTFPNTKPPLKKKIYGGSQSHCNGVKICPVLNVPPPYIGKGAANLFGLGSFLKNGKEKNRK